MKVTVLEGQRGFLFKNGKFVKMLGAGSYSTFGGKDIRIVNVDDEAIYLPDVDVQILTRDEDFTAQTMFSDAKDGELTLHFVNGVFVGRILAGRHYFWTVNRTHSFLCVDLSKPELPEDFPSFLVTMPQLSSYLTRVEITEKQKGLLYYDKKFVKILDAGTYYFVKGTVKVDVDIMDICLQQQDIVGQEILTADKVSLRINCACTYRISDLLKAKTATSDYRTQLHNAIQFALREYVGERKLDDILGAKGEMSEYISKKVKAKAKELFLEVEETAVKDIILPGEIREIMNTVLVAEKRAQANVITRREEVASTRSLLNTAKLMEENETLYKLKELEYIERICERVGSINLNGGGDILSQLTAVLGRKNSDK